MPEEPKPEDPGAVWRNQPAEEPEVRLEHLAGRRARELYARTRSEILMSVGAALLFVAVMAWRFSPARDPRLQLGLLVVVAWVVVSLFRFRRQIWRKAAPDERASASLEYCRQELERRRDHLRNAWVWHGPLLLALMMFLVTVLDSAYPGRLRNVLPLIALLAVWTAFGIWRRRRQARELQREIDELGPKQSQP